MGLEGHQRTGQWFTNTVLMMPKWFTDVEYLNKKTLGSASSNYFRALDRFRKKYLPAQATLPKNIRTLEFSQEKSARAGWPLHIKQPERTEKKDTFGNSKLVLKC
jgi:hypothetical protein